MSDDLPLITPEDLRTFGEYELRTGYKMLFECQDLPISAAQKKKAREEIPLYEAEAFRRVLIPGLKRPKV